MKDCQATKEAFSPQKRTHSTGTVPYDPHPRKRTAHTLRLWIMTLASVLILMAASMPMIFSSDMTRCSASFKWDSTRSISLEKKKLFSL
jgi:hypothetical protein